ncbi:hypothetical protein Q5H92_06295 [Hymenobacter sp. M29]|uniref:Uncharacterized protein n=1 Tax=Hymenobacter mellowenesis TaxID=3063995 RepID=A0ABT9A9A7_9BACT|nr:hypothetical protein [Hymenobacter sp. M29]MDO7845959.1 hypothetical protein [Hymenobacter sp. M29]
MRIYKLLLPVLGLVLIGVDAKAQQKLIVAKKTKPISTPNFVVLPYYASDSDITGFEKEAKPAPLNNEELSKVEMVLIRAAQENKLKVYKRQYVCVIDQHGDKLVWVNCFCHAFNDWRNSIQMVMDGGDCFYSLIINLSTGKYTGLIVNGEA